MRILRGETLHEVELSIRRLRPSWTRIFHYSGSRVSCMGHESLAFLTVSDVTERKQTERELERENRGYVALVTEDGGYVSQSHDAEASRLRSRRIDQVSHPAWCDLAGIGQHRGSRRLVG
jgi:hypothetical protein